MSLIERQPQLRSHTKDRINNKKERQIKELNKTKVNTFKPFYTHFHFVIKREKEKDVSQSSVYLQYCIEEILDNSRILDEFEEKVMQIGTGNK